MIAQSLGGMEIVVGMSLLAGGLVLDKKRTGPGKRTPHQLSLHFNSYASYQQCLSHWARYSRHDRCDHASSRVDSCEPYPTLRTLVERSEGVSRDANELDEWFHTLGAEEVLLRE